MCIFTSEKQRKSEPCGARLKMLIYCHIDLSSEDLTKGILGEFLVSDLEKTYLLIGNGGLVILVDELLEVALEIGDALLFKESLIGIDLTNDGIERKTSPRLALVNYDLNETLRCRKRILDFLRVNVLTV